MDISPISTIATFTKRWICSIRFAVHPASRQRRI
jgi:hypothetical protein